MQCMGIIINNNNNTHGDNFVLFIFMKTNKQKVVVGLHTYTNTVHASWVHGNPYLSYATAIIPICIFYTKPAAPGENLIYSKKRAMASVVSCVYILLFI